MQRLDGALRAVGCHPLTLSHAVKLATLKIVKSLSGKGDINQSDLEDAAHLLCYCATGPDEYAETNGPWKCAAIEERLVAAFIGDKRSCDEDLVLLTFCAGVIHPDVVQLYGLKVI